jgi:hypothetical protein
LLEREFKFAIRSAGKLEWEAGSNRKITCVYANNSSKSPSLRFADDQHLYHQFRYEEHGLFKRFSNWFKGNKSTTTVSNNYQLFLTATDHIALSELSEASWIQNLQQRLKMFRSMQSSPESKPDAAVTKDVVAIMGNALLRLVPLAHGFPDKLLFLLWSFGGAAMEKTGFTDIGDTAFSFFACLDTKGKL